MPARLSLSACERDSSPSRVSRRSAWAAFSSSKRSLALGAGGGRFALLDGDRVARFLDLAPDPGHPFHRGLGLVAQRLDPAGDGVVVVLDLAQVVGAGVDFRPAGRFEDDVDDVRLAGLIDRDQPFAQHLERPAQTRPDHRQPLLVGLELGAGPLEFGLLVGEFGFERGLALAQDGDFAEHRVDRRVLLGDRRAQRVFALADLVELALGRVELFLQGLGGGGPAGSPERNDGEAARQRAAASASDCQRRRRTSATHANETPASVLGVANNLQLRLQKPGF